MKKLIALVLVLIIASFSVIAYAHESILSAKDKVEITAALEERQFVQEINEKKPVMPSESGQQKHIDVKINDSESVKTNADSNLEKKLDNLSEMLKNQLERDTQFTRTYFLI